jgi:Anti-sigma factor NepR
MNDPKIDPASEGASEQAGAQGGQIPPEDAARVRETLGAGLRKFYDSVLDEPVPTDWLNLVGGGTDRGQQ